MELLSETIKGLFGKKDSNSKTIPALDRHYDTIEEEIKNIELLMNDHSEDDIKLTEQTEIQKFIKGSVFITGGTGFLGKVLIEKLLRTCDNVEKIFLLVRPKKGKDMKTRVDEIFDDALYKRLMSEKPKSRFKIVTVNGDISLPGLGMSAEDRKMITNEVSIIFHSAATVRFDEKLKLAVAINVKGTLEMCELARECNYLKSMVHISTAFAHCNYKHIEEQVYNAPLHYEKLIQLTESKSDKELEPITTEMLQRWKYPNTYCFTKAVAENVVREVGNDLPICIHRPAIVVASYKEPIKSWIDNLYGPTGALVGAGLGLIRVIRIDDNCRAEIVPVDCVVNSIIAAAYKTGTKLSTKLPVYNYVSARNNIVTWGDYVKLCVRYGLRFPTARAIWYVCFFHVSSMFWFTFLTFFLHTLPAFFADIVLACIGSKVRLGKIYTKIYKFSHVIAYFALQQWCFESQNMENLWDDLSDNDKKLFFFDMRQIDWERWSATHCIGLRMYLVKDDLSTLGRARKHWDRLYYIHTAVRTVFYLIVIYIVYSSIKVLCNIF